MGNYIPYLAALKEEDQREYDGARHRSAHQLERCMPEYLKNYSVELAIHGLLVGDDLYAGDYTSKVAVDDDELDESDGFDGRPVSQEVIESIVDGLEGLRLREQEMWANDAKLFLQYAATGNRMGLRQLLSSKRVGSIDQADAHGRSAVFLAAAQGHIECLEFLITSGARYDSPASPGWLWTPLHAATFHGQLQCMDLLIHAKHSVNTRDAYGCTPLILAASSPKIYIADLVNKADRQKRAALCDKARKHAANRVQARRGIQHADDVPDAHHLWRRHPDRFELIVMDTLFRAPDLDPDIKDIMGRSPLIYAAMGGRHIAVSRLLARRASPHDADKNLRTALWYAVHKNHRETVELLINAAADVNTRDDFRRAPLHEAIAFGNEAIATMLMEAEADVQAHDCTAVTPLMLAMQLQNHRIFVELLHRSADLDVMDSRGRNVVTFAIDTGMFLELVPVLERLGEFASTVFRLPDPQGRNAVHHAVVLPDPSAASRTVETLVASDPEAATQGDCNGDSALHLASQLGRYELIQLMLEGLQHGDVKNNREETPLHVAAHGGHMACVLALLQDRGEGAKCQADLVDCDQRNVFMHACVSGHLDLVNVLLQNRDGQHDEICVMPIDVNQSDKDGMTPLMIAAQEGHWQILPSLVLAGCNVAAKDTDGFTALHWAAIEDEMLAVTCLLELALDIDATDFRGWTPLMHAVAVGANDAVRALVDAHADLALRNVQNDTAIQICMKRKASPSVPHKEMELTRSILLDGIQERDQFLAQAIPALGHFAISVLRAEDLYLEGRADVNPYICLQFCPRQGATPQVSFTSCVLRDQAPIWNEVFRFEVDELDPSGYLVAWVLDAPGDTPEEVIECAQYGVGSTQMRQAKKDLKKSGFSLVTKAPHPATSLEKSFRRIMDRADVMEEKDIERMQDLEMAAQTMQIPPDPLADSIEGRRGYIPLEERRWTDVTTLRRLLQRNGVDVPEPLAPRAHVPLGCMVVRFRQLRAAVWGTEPVEMTRSLRLNPRASLAMAIDFRPRYFATRDTCPEEALKAEDIFALANTDEANLLPMGKGTSAGYQSVPCVRWSPGELEEDSADALENYSIFKKVAIVAAKHIGAQEGLLGGKKQARSSKVERQRRNELMHQPLQVGEMQPMLQPRQNRGDDIEAAASKLKSEELKFGARLLELLDSSRLF